MLRLTGGAGSDLVLETAGTDITANQAVRMAKKGSTIVMVGYYASGEDVYKRQASILQDSNTIGSKAVDVAVDIANGKEIEKEYDIPYQLITKDNYEDFLTE